MIHCGGSLNSAGTTGSFPARISPKTTLTLFV